MQACVLLSPTLQLLRVELLPVEGSPWVTVCDATEEVRGKTPGWRNFSPYEATLLTLWFERPGRALIRKGCVSYLMGLSTDSYGLHNGLSKAKMQVMTDTIRLPDELGAQLRQRREALGLSKSELAERAGKVREVIYRLEAGEDTTVSSLLAVLGALGLALRLERAGLPSASEVARRFQSDDEPDADENRRHHHHHGPAA